MKQNNMYDIASNMDAILKDPEYKSMFSSSAVLEKLAFKRVADEDQPTEIEVELSAELMGEPLEVTAAKKCKVCDKPIKGTCKCAKSGCEGSCKKGCTCGCKTKKAGVEMNDMLIKSAFDSLLSASSDLEEAGLENLSANTLILMNHLIVEAKKAKMSKEDKAKAKAKADEVKAKVKAKAEAEKAKKMKADAKAKKDMNDAKDAKAKAKAKMEALRALKDSKKK